MAALVSLKLWGRGVQSAGSRSQGRGWLVQGDCAGGGSADSFGVGFMRSRTAAQPMRRASVRLAGEPSREARARGGGRSSPRGRGISIDVSCHVSCLAAPHGTGTHTHRITCYRIETPAERRWGRGRPGELKSLSHHTCFLLEGNLVRLMLAYLKGLSDSRRPITVSTTIRPGPHETRAR
jgi:hypothetical protein